MHDRKSISIIRIIRQGKLLKKILLWADANALSCINTAPVTLPYENMQLSTRNSIHTNTDLPTSVSFHLMKIYHSMVLCFVRSDEAWVCSGNLSLFFRLVEKNSSHFQKEWDYYSPLMKTERRWRLLQFTFLSLCPPVSAFQQGGAFRFSGSQRLITVLLTCIYIVHCA